MITEALITLFLFALNPVLNKYILSFISVKSLVLLTGVAYCLTATVLVFFLYDKDIGRDTATLFADWRLLLLLLSFPIIHMITHYFYFSLIRDYKTYYVTAIMATYPLLTALLGYLMLNETITVMHFIAILFIVTGIVMLEMNGGKK